MNDAKCDPAGRLFAGTTAFDFATGAGALYRIDPDWSCEAVVRGVTTSNGTAWAPDGTPDVLHRLRHAGRRRVRLRRRRPAPAAIDAGS